MHAAHEAARELRHIPDGELDRLFDQVPELPALDLSLQVELPTLVSPAFDRLADAMTDDDQAAAGEPIDELLGALDTALERARLARAVISLRAGGRLDAKLAAVAIIDLESDSRALIGASLIEATAVRIGLARTPAGISLAA